MPEPARPETVCRNLPPGSADDTGYAGGPASVKVVSSRATSSASAAPVRWKTSSACRRRAWARVAWPAARGAANP
jgi:hypothetical protein